MGRTVIITGGARGIGAAYAKAAAAEGARVAVCDILAPDDTVTAIKAAGGEAFGDICDITDVKSVEKFVAKTLGTFGSIEGLVNNAAMFASLRPKPMDQITSEEFDQVMRINVRGTFEIIKAVHPTMRAQKYGKIVNIGSGTFFKGIPMMLHYVSSKGAIIAMTRALAREFGPDGIRVNCIAPGFIVSEGVAENDAYPENSAAPVVQTRCLAREQEPEDLTGAMAYLLSSASDFMTGQTMVVDGGSAMN